jgi:hypothetical protein
MEEIQNAVLDCPVGRTQLINSIAQKIGRGPSQFVSGCGKQPHIVQAFRYGLRREDIEPVYQRNASICLAENKKFRWRHAFFTIVRFFANTVKPASASRNSAFRAPSGSVQMNQPASGISLRQGLATPKPYMMYGRVPLTLLFSARKKDKPYIMYGLTPYFFLRATARTFRVCEIAPGGNASLMMSRSSPGRIPL